MRPRRRGRLGADPGDNRDGCFATAGDTSWPTGEADRIGDLGRGAVRLDVVSGQVLVRPVLRGVSHAVAVPLIVAATVVLVTLARTAVGAVAAAVYGVSAILLFGVSALYHRGRWSPAAAGVLQRIDHANIFLVIAGTYTPFAVLILRGETRAAVLAVVWVGAGTGVLFRAIWVGAPRWLYTLAYVLLGWVAAFLVPQLLEGAGVAAFVLLVTGGGLYSIGALVYALRRPDPAPQIFGYHEIFHALTIAAFTLQYIAVSAITY